ncbi:triphosphoribosyl-dephospho-CoA synthase [Methanobrevibacter filiformis]|uniref:2-(5''-triphosphoribosyl)-3'-dephosphocoenzyme-A synthase n=1 Tax=Methanobrevibacter filiformis TaxID=55758 RepID=A0A166BLA0_9EURY|nr:triphosphoribosyl-dephospho-CoA synthase [Methanobrevibacter filiformis]KZX13516.1 2-(5''-triphosphoribosyl)-3'-dephosphocoenzyme-A synthase [Methanobrevibacter filiformis]
MNPEEIAKIAQIASVLEVSGYPKPGNVHRNRDFHDMVFEDFLISGIVIGDIIKEAASHMRSIGNSMDFRESNIGEYIHKAVMETDRWVANNTNLGIIMLLTPIAMSAAISDNLNELRENIHNVIKYSTVSDAINLYLAISIADAGGMGDQKDLDVNSNDSIIELEHENLNIFDVLNISSSWDSLAKELTTKMPITFEIGFPIFSNLRKTFSINTSTVVTFLTILSNVPDTLISRKYGNEKAKKVSDMAKTLLNYLGPVDSNDSLSSEHGLAANKIAIGFDEKIFKEKLYEFDNYLFENKLNPGTTADLTASSIMVSYLSDFLLP